MRSSGSECPDQCPSTIFYDQYDFAHTRDQQGFFNPAPSAECVGISRYPQSTEFGHAGTLQGVVRAIENLFEESSLTSNSDASIDAFNRSFVHPNAHNIPEVEANSLNISVDAASMMYIPQEGMNTFYNPHGYSHDAVLFDNALNSSFGNSNVIHLGGDSSGVVDPFQQPFGAAQYGNMTGPYLPDDMDLSVPMPQLAQPALSGKPRTSCTWFGCSESFARHTDLDRHLQAVHYGIKHHCGWPGCANNRGKGYCRLEKLRTHQKEKHGYALV